VALGEFALQSKRAPGGALFLLLLLGAAAGVAQWRRSNAKKAALVSGLFFWGVPRIERVWLSVSLLCKAKERPVGRSFYNFYRVLRR